ncbi:ATP-binding protein [Salinimicrobium sp. CDJ15-81-2]|nr:ATP-binding protein [Salinimicrobium nanhaiense]
MWKWGKVFLLVVLSLSGCKEREEVEVVHAPGTAGYFYNKGLESTDFQEKLNLYSQGLEAVQSVKDTNLVVLLDAKVYALHRLNRYEETLPLIDSLIKVAELQEDTYFQAKALHRKYSTYSFLSRPEDAFEFAFLSRQLTLKMGDTAGAGRRSLDMANTQFSLGDYAGSQESATEALKYLNIDTDRKYAGSAHNVLGLLYNEQHLHEEALKEFRNALKFAESRTDSLSYLHNIALVYKNQGKYGSAMKIMKDLVKAEEPSDYSKTRYRDNYAYMRWLQNPNARMDKELLAMVEERKKNNDLEGLLSNYSHLSDYYSKPEPAKAKQFALAYMETAKEIGNPNAEADAIKKLLSLSNSPDKEQYLKRYLFLNDSLKDANLKTRYRFAKIKFDEERKQQQIALLEAENTTMSLKAEKFKTGTTISSLSALLVLITAAALLYTVRQKSKRERIKQVYLTESRISKRIHDEIANDIYNVMSTLEPAGHTPIVDKLEKIYLRTRDISRENSEIDTKENYLQSLLSLLGSTSPVHTRLIIRGAEDINWDKLKNEKKIVLYRVLQEMMINMKKHSRATLVALVFSSDKNRLIVKYSDNGIGTDLPGLQSGNGIKNLQNRLKTVNGNIIFDTEGKGLKAEISLSTSA